MSSGSPDPRAPGSRAGPREEVIPGVRRAMGRVLIPILLLLPLLVRAGPPSPRPGDGRLPSAPSDAFASGGEADPVGPSVLRGEADGDTATVVRWAAGVLDTTVVLPADSLEVRLGATWISGGEADVRWIDLTTGAASGPLDRGVHYLLDPRRGRLRLLAPPPVGQALRLRLHSFPGHLPVVFRAHQPWIPADTLTAAAGPRGDVASASRDVGASGAEDARLEISGSKTFSVQVGSQQDLALEQSLDLAIAGRIGRNVDVRAVLTDRDTPLQPEGTSTELQDLDRVLVEVVGPRARMRLGDFETVLPRSTWADYRRQLAGVEGEVHLGAARLAALGATLPGTFLTLEFLGTEGVQGPYALRRDAAGLADPIVAGSETVWLDGRKLTRGEDADYIVDYAGGELTFTARHAITAYTRIAVDFQVGDRPFEGRVYRVGTESGGPGSGVSFDWLVERDAADEPLRFDLTEEERAVLAGAGDDVDSLGRGVEFVGPGRGDYELVSVDTVAAPFFVYRGADRGEFLVRFVEVGAGAGDYVDSTLVDSTLTEIEIFVFVGEDEGDFLPARELFAPESRALFALRAEHTWGGPGGDGAPRSGDSGLGGGRQAGDSGDARGADDPAARRGSASVGSTDPAEATGLHPRLRLAFDGALSDLDRNTLSARDDDDNLGGALALTSSLDLLAGTAGAPAELGLDLGLRKVDARFAPLGRVEDSYFALDWNLDPDRLGSGDERITVGARARRGRQSLRFELGRLDNTRDFVSERAILETGAGWRSLQLDARVLRARSEDDLRPAGGSGRRERDGASLRWNGRWIASQVRYAGERSETGSGEGRSGSAYREGGLRLGTGSRFSTLRAAVEYVERRTEDLEGSVDRERDRGRTRLAEVEWRDQAGRSLGVSYTRRTLEPVGGGEERASELGSFRWLLRTQDGLWRQEGRFELSTQEERERLRVLEFVGVGQGHYDSLGVYQGVGDYEVLVRESDDPVRRNAVDWSLRTELDRGRGGAGEPATRLLRRAWDELRLVHYWTTRAETGRSAGFLWERLAPALWGSEALDRVDVLQRADLTTLDGARFLAPRLGLLLRRTQSGGESGFAEQVATRTFSLRLRSRPLERWSLDLEGELERDRRTVTSAGSALQSGWNTRGLGIEQSWRFRRGVALEAETGFRRRARHESVERADVWHGAPRVVLTPRGESRVEMGTKRTSVARRGATGRASRELERSGWESRVLATVRLRTAFDFTLFLRESRPDRGRRVRDVRMELRATF